MTTPPVPNGLAAIRATFGDPLEFLNDKATWERTRLVTRQLVTPLAYAYGPAAVTRIRAHNLIANELVAALEACLAAGVPRERLKYGGCYVWRAKRGAASRLSLHTWGVAVDLEPAENPFGSRWADDGRMLDARIVTTFTGRGWRWGDDFRDPMHFQWATGY